MSIPGWVPIDQASDYLSVSRDTIRRMIARGEIQARRFGPRLIRVNIAEIEASGRPVQHVGGDAA